MPIFLPLGMPPMLLEDGLKALQNKQYPTAIELLDAYCHSDEVDRRSPFYVQAQIALARAYRGSGELDKAIALCHLLETYPNSEVQTWATGFISILSEQDNGGMSSGSLNSAASLKKAGRVAQTGVKLLMPKKTADSLTFSVGITLIWMFAIEWIFLLGCWRLISRPDSSLHVAISVIAVFIFNGLLFFLAPHLMDGMQRLLYQIRWVNLAEIRNHSPEASEVVLRVCREKKLKFPRLGIINDPNPTVFTYGSLPSTACIVVSEGLLNILEDDEIATVYAHEMGHIANWDFALMTMVTTILQCLYLPYWLIGRIGQKGNAVVKNMLTIPAMGVYFVYHWANCLIGYLSRTREYHADLFAAQTTGNPNGLTRALIKIAYKMAEKVNNADQPPHLLESTRALGICDPKTPFTSATAYQIGGISQRIGQIFLWDLFNPWGWWLELKSTHPLTGKRIRALTLYAQQLELDTELSMGAVLKEENKLSKGRFYANFVLDILILVLPLLGIIVGIVMANTAEISQLQGGLWGFGGGMLLKTFLVYPSYARSLDTDIFSLMSDPYLSPIRGLPIRLKGQLLGRADVGYHLGFQDRSGILNAHYCHGLGWLGTLFFSWKHLKKGINPPASTVGWFRRGLTPSVDMAELATSKHRINAYPRLWCYLIAIIAILLGIYF